MNLLGVTLTSIHGKFQLENWQELAIEPEVGVAHMYLMFFLRENISAKDGHIVEFQLSFVFQSSVSCTREHKIRTKRVPSREYIMLDQNTDTCTYMAYKNERSSIE